MSGNIQPYQAVFAQEQARLAALLRSGSARVGDLAVSRVSTEIMAQELQSPSSVLAYERLPANASGLRGPDRWRAECLVKAEDQINPQHLSPERYVLKTQEYLNLGRQVVMDKRIRDLAVVDKQNGISYLVGPERPVVREIMKLIADELMLWFKAQPNSKPMMSMSAMAGYSTMLSERPDLVALLRMAQDLPLDFEVMSVPVDRPAVVECIELAIGLVPFVGNAVAAYEIYTGRDLFGYRLTDIERGILAAAILLPIAGRVVKGGRILYTEARLVSLYGRDAAGWSRVVRASERAEAATGGKALRQIEQAGVELRAQKRLVDRAAIDAAPAIPAMVRGAGGTTHAMQPAIETLLGELQVASGSMKTLDSPSLLRILEKGPNVDHLKGQLLEELVESQVLPWLRTRTGPLALGVRVPAGKRLEFFPGHMIRDIKGRQISDGILAYRHAGELHIVAVFEAKAGKSAARELGLAKGGWSSLTEDAKAELRANAKDVWRERRVEANRQGLVYVEKVEDVMKEYLLSEQGGQVRRDIERLADAGGKPTLRIGSERLVVNMSPTKTKFFGVVPKNVSVNTIEAQLKAEGVSYEMLAVDVKDTELKALAERIKPLAAALAPSMP